MDCMGGGRGGGARTESLTTVSLFPFLSIQCKGGSYPEMCNAEAPTLWSTAGAEAGFLCILFSCTATYSLGMNGEISRLK
jgi:hypothetical protein